MMEELRTSSDLLKAALERYLDACSVITNCFEGNTFSAISHMVTGELQSIHSYETAIKKARVKISRVRNSCRSIVPINTLPPEILARIFQLVLHSQRCWYNSKEGGGRLSIKRPEILSYVCSRWYQIAAGLNDLWKHIGLVPFHSHDKLLARGAMLAARAGHLPLEIHIVGGDPKSRLQQPDNNLNAFCVSVAPRLSSLELVTREGVMRAHLSILEACFSNCVPGTLNRLTLYGHFNRTSTYSFIGPQRLSYSRIQVLNMPNQQFEDILLHVKVLNLRGVFLPWSSRAYHGLVELTIYTYFECSSVSITESQLMGILAASPMLRGFHFGIRITELGQDNTSPFVALNELQSISLGFTDDSQRKALLRMISPGSKPLQMTIRFYKGTFASQPDEVFGLFLGRANVTELRIKSRENDATFPDLPKLLIVSSSLRQLILSGYHLNSCPCAPETGGDEQLPVGLRLNSLNLFRCTVDLARLQQTTKLLSIQTLRLAEDCQLIVQGSSQTPDKCQSELCEMFPAVKSIVGKGFTDNLSLDD